MYSASGIGPPDHLVALVVVAEDEDAVTERGLGGGDPDLEVLWRGVGVALVERVLESEHVVGALHG
jgi:hypothetical protein